MIIEVFQPAFATDGIANQQSHKVDDRVRVRTDAAQSGRALKLLPARRCVEDSEP